MARAILNCLYAWKRRAYRGRPVYFDLISPWTRAGSHAGRTNNRQRIDRNRDRLCGAFLDHPAGNHDGAEQHPLRTKRPAWRGAAGSAGISFAWAGVILWPLTMSRRYRNSWILFMATALGLIVGAIVLGAVRRARTACPQALAEFADFLGPFVGWADARPRGGSRSDVRECLQESADLSHRGWRSRFLAGWE